MFYVKSLYNWFSKYNYFPMSHFFFTLINIFIPINGTKFSPMFTKKHNLCIDSEKVAMQIQYKMDLIEIFIDLMNQIELAQDRDNYLYYT